MTVQTLFLKIKMVFYGLEPFTETLIGLIGKQKLSLLKVYFSSLIEWYFQNRLTTSLIIRYPSQEIKAQLLPR